MTGQVANWAGNITFAARQVARPTSVEQLRRFVAGSDRVRALGTGHSFNTVADTTGDLVSLAGLPPTVEIAADRRTVTVAGGVRYGELAATLQTAGLALHNLASLPHISVAGACATATHGSGDRNGNLATAVAAIELVTADGDLVRLARGTDADFAGAVVALGALGVVTALTLDVEPAFEIAQYVYDDLPLDALADHQAEIFASGYSVSVFTDWASGLGRQVWVKRRLDATDDWQPRPHWLDGTLADGPRHPVPGGEVANCTGQLGTPGAWHTRLPHFRLGFTPSSGDELQSEYLLPRTELLPAVTALREIGDVIAPVLQISELRTIAADELWLSPNHQRDSVGVHFTWIADGDAVAPVMAAVEERLTPLGARPHWGKLSGVEPDRVRASYPRWADFAALLDSYDPAGKFRNSMIDTYFPRG